MSVKLSRKEEIIVKEEEEEELGGHTNSSFEERFSELRVVHEQFSENCFLPRIEDLWFSCLLLVIGDISR